MASERKFVAENVRRVLLKEYLMKEVSRAGFGGLDVQRTPLGTRIILTTERPGLVIGRRGQTIKNLTTVIEERFGFENPQIEVQEVGFQKPERELVPVSEEEAAGTSAGPDTQPSGGLWTPEPADATSSSPVN